MTWPHLSSSPWSGVGGRCGCRCARADASSEVQCRMAVRALERSMGASSWLQAAAAWLASRSDASLPARSAWPGTQWRVIVLPPVASEFSRLQTHWATDDCWSSGPRLSSWSPDRESEQSSTLLMRAREGGGSSWRRVRASDIATNSALMLLHTLPAGAMHSSVRPSRCSSRSAPPPPWMVPSLADPSDQMVQSGSGMRASAARAASFLRSGGSVLLVGCGRSSTNRTASPQRCQGGAPW